MVVGAEVQHVKAFSRAFGLVDDVAAASVQAVAMLAVQAVFKALFRHVVPVALPAAEPMRKIIRGTAARNLPAVPIRSPAGHYSSAFE